MERSRGAPRGPVDRGRRGTLALMLGFCAGAARSATEFPDVAAGASLSFPADEGSHPAFRVEWWYVTGWLRDRDAREYGFQLTFFRSRTGIDEGGASRFAPKQLLFAHAAIADPASLRLRVDQRSARAGFELAGASVGRMRVWIGNWRLEQSGSRYAATIRARDFAIDIALGATAPVMPEGDDGVSRKGPDSRDSSFYYSRPQLGVTGSLGFDDSSRDVSGIAWLDHEWSSRYSPANAVGWDWCGINFDDGGALMAFRMRGTDAGSLWAGGTYRDAGRATRTFAAPEVKFVPERRWRSPRTGVEYPVAIRIHAAEMELTLEPLFDDQELDARASVGLVYWEGAVRAIRDGRRVGRGYLELTGYGEAVRI